MSLKGKPVIGFIQNTMAMERRKHECQDSGIV